MKNARLADTNQCGPYRYLSEIYYDEHSKKLKGGLRIHSLSTPPFRRPIVGDTWGNWILRKNFLCWNGNDGHDYEIDLRPLICECPKQECEHFQETMNWIAHMSIKSLWLNSNDIGNLVFALKDIVQWDA